MNATSLPSTPRTSTLRLEVVFLEEGKDIPSVRILVDGSPALEGLAPTGYVGFGPDEILMTGGAFSTPSPPRRVALYQCSCGEPGCGVVAPIVSADERLVRWSDFRDLTGVFANPTIDAEEERRYAGPDHGHALPIGDLVFDRAAYEAEVARARGDRTWESQERQTARLVREALRCDPEYFRASGVEFGWFEFAPWRDEPTTWIFETHPVEGGAQNLSTITASPGAADKRAGEILERLRSVPVEQWPVRFPFDR